MNTYNPNVLNNLTGHQSKQNTQSRYTKEQILNLFQDNLTGNIDPADLRMFVQAIWAAKENSLIKVTDPKHFDFHKIKKDAGWQPEIPLEQSLKDILDYWREQVTTEN